MVLEAKIRRFSGAVFGTRIAISALAVGRTTLRGTELTTAKALRLKIPEPFLLRVDEAVE